MDEQTNVPVEPEAVAATTEVEPVAVDETTPEASPEASPEVVDAEIVEPEEA